MELERTIPFHYSLFNLEAHLLLNRYAEHVEFDRWNAIRDGRGVKQGLITWCRLSGEPDFWPHSDLQGIVWDSALRVLLQSVRGYAKQSASYREALKCAWDAAAEGTADVVSGLIEQCLPPDGAARSAWLLCSPDKAFTPLSGECAG